MEKKKTLQLKLRDHPFLRHLVDEGMVWSAAGLDKVITIVAVVGDYGDWTAYLETPQCGPDHVVELGNKLPPKVAAELFPEWARTLKWRP